MNRTDAICKMLEKRKDKINTQPRGKIEIRWSHSRLSVYQTEWEEMTLEK